MDTTLDFVTRARRAFQEFRHPTDATRANDFSAQAPPTTNEQAEEARNAALDQRIASLETSARLAEFRLLVGIVQDKSFTGHFGFQHNRRPQASLSSRPAPNMGIYTTVCDAEIKAKRNFKGASRMINFCLGLQIVVAAALTALGASNGSRGAVTTFGAINTVIAGLMSYLKGSGLPNRLKYFQHEWHKVRAYIEERERDFYLGMPGLDVHDEVEKIRVMFEDVRTDIETNTPERFVSTSQVRQATTATTAARERRQIITRPEPSYSSSMHKGWNEKVTEAQDAYHSAQGTAHGLYSDLNHLKGAMEDRLHDFGRMEKEIEVGGRRLADEKKQDLERGIQSSVREVEQIGKEVELTARSAAAQRVAERTRQVDNAVAYGSDATRAGLAQQQDYLNAALAYEKEKANEGPPPHRST